MVLCTSCSSHVRPVVAIDIDGTIGDYHGSWFRFASDYYGREYSGEGFDGTVPLHQYMDLSRSEYRTCKLAYRQGGQKRMMPLFPGAGQLVRGMRMAGAEIWITTTRPYNRFDSTDPDTRHWLERHNLPFDHLIFDDDKYGVLSNMVDPSRIVGVLEDLPENYDRAHELGLQPFLIKTHYNRAIHRPFEVGSLYVALEVLRAKVSLWIAE